MNNHSYLSTFTTVTEWVDWYIQEGYEVVPIRKGLKKPTGKDAKEWNIKPFTTADFRPDDSIGVKLGTNFKDRGYIVDIDADWQEAARILEYFFNNNKDLMCFGHAAKPYSHLILLTKTPFQSLKIIDPLIKNIDAKKACVVEIRGCTAEGKANQTVFPPSIHESNNERTFYPDSALTPSLLSEEKLVKLYEHIGAASLIAAYLQDGICNTTLLALYGVLFRSEWTLEQVTQFANFIYAGKWGTAAEFRSAKSEVENSYKRHQENQTEYGFPTLKEHIPDEIVKLVAKLLKLKSPKGNVNFKMNDTGNAEQFIEDHGNEVLYCLESKEFHAWDKTQWTAGPHIPNNLFVQTMEKLRKEAETLPDLTEKEARTKESIIGYYKSAQNANRIREGMHRIKDQSEIHMSTNSFDSATQLLNVKNGVIDCKTGELLPHDPKYLFTRTIPYDYNPSAKSELFETFLNETFDSNAEEIAWVQKAVGYSLLGKPTKELFFTLVGPGGRGKGTFLSAIATILGGDDGYMKVISIATLTGRKTDGSKPEPDVAKLKDARIVTCQEGNQTVELNYAFIKSITGNDEICTRTLHEKSFTFQPKFVLWLAVNSPPTFQADTAMIRRYYQIVFDQLPKTVNTNLKTLLKQPENVEGVLAWAVEGAVRYFNEGLGEMPKRFAHATSQTLEDNNVVKTILQRECIKDTSLSNYGMLKVNEFYPLVRNEQESSASTIQTKNQVKAALKDAGVTLFYDRGSWKLANYRFISDEERQNRDDYTERTAEGYVKFTSDVKGKKQMEDLFKKL